MKALSIGATGMHAQQMNVEVISNNIANMSTTGYKQQRAQFQDLLYQTISRPGATSSSADTIVPSGIQLGAGVKMDSVMRVHTQGSLDVTDNELDLAINGEGYFAITLPDGQTAYTRAGNFQTNDEGVLVTGDGFELDPSITIPADTTDITINRDGEVIAKIDGTVALSNLGQIDIVTFANDAGLESIGDNLYLETPASGTPVTGTAGEDGFGAIIQGTLELSNVDIVSEITRMISAQRAYEMNSKVIQTSDEMLGTISQLR